MKSISSKRQDGYPHRISFNVGRNLRWPIEISDAPLSPGDERPYAIHVAGAYDRAGRLTAEARSAIVAHFCAGAPDTQARSCIVWNERSCTYILPDGTSVEGQRPPEGEPVEPADYEAVNGFVLNVRYVELPKGAPWSHLCIRRLGGDYVEISSGEPMSLGHFDELPEEGPGSELRRHLDANGRLVRPKTFRGVLTTGIRNGFELVGPVQPTGCSTRIVAAWPDAVHRACEEVAEMKLPAKLLMAAWRAVDPDDRGLTYVGSVEAA